MSKPERLEDLGRIREKLEKLFDDCLALEAGDMHDEYFEQVFRNSEKRDELYRSLKRLHMEMLECLHIACGLEE